jgi:hypothetical protein
MLTALAEEVHNMDKNRRQEIVTVTSQQWNDIAALAQSFIPEQMAAGNRWCLQYMHDASGQCKQVAPQQGSTQPLCSTSSS